MVLKLDSRVALVWRDPFSMQLGVDPVRVVLREVTTAEERMLAALGDGISRSGLSMVGRAAGVEEADVVKLLDAVAPLLLDEEPPTVAPTVAITGYGPTVEQLATVLAASGALVRVSPTVTETPCDLGVAVGHYVLDPDVYGFWLRRDLPHLPIVFGEGAVAIGPLVEPGLGPCLYCLEYHRRDANPAWPAIASQLWGRHSGAETPLAVSEVVATTARLVLRRLTSGREGGRLAAAGASLRISADTGEQTRRDWMPHPECGCVALPEAASPIPPGSDSAGAVDASSPPRTPRRAAASGERG